MAPAPSKLHLFITVAPWVFTIGIRLLTQKIRLMRNYYASSSTSNTSSEECRTIVIIGASYAGTWLAKALSAALPPTHRIIIIEKNSHMNYVFNFPRYSVVPGYEDSAFLPYEPIVQGKWVRKGIVEMKQGVVSSVSVNEKSDGGKGGEVVLEGGEKIPFDILAIATGCNQPFPARLGSVMKVGAVDELKGMQEMIKKSARIACVGGGAVGVQLATDIKSWFPEKEVWLVHSRGRVLSSLGERLGEFVSGKLKDMGIVLRLGDRPVVEQEEKGMGGSLRFKSGEVEAFDLIIPCTGQTPNSSFMKSFGPDILADSGMIKVKSTLQLSMPEHSHIFALGDVADTHAAKMGRAGMMQADVVAENILSLARGQEASTQYTPHFVEGAMKLSLGKGNIVMYVQENEEREHVWPVKTKADDLDIANAWKMLGADPENYSV